MAKIIERVKAMFHDRRTHNEPVPIERRAKQTRKNIEDRLDEAVHDFEQTVRIKRDDFVEKLGRTV